MTQTRLILALLVGLTIGGSVQTAEAGWLWGRGYSNNANAQHASNLPWHGGYAYQNYEAPVAMVVPPNANMQTNYSWGMPSSRMTPVYHQFGRANAGGITGHPSSLGVTPYWPNDTQQFGVYSVRGPWTWNAADLNYGWHLGFHHRANWNNKTGSCPSGNCGNGYYGNGHYGAPSQGVHGGSVITEEGYVPGSYNEQPIAPSAAPTPAAPPEA
ncbi:hypothetical protein [Bremerella alba]|uniref:Uncharacterized protein n=1 Tax=Bremerella alba TaxID=980252 RepID=A0A7V8VAI8_9BACT|nr:hypothetical protein [Bremerella alba]MBA2117988.1 hypothetical protein [Bremerella alba]